MADAEDPVVTQFAMRLRDRRFYKCIDIRLEIAHIFDPDSQNTQERIDKIDRCCAAINHKLTEMIDKSTDPVPRILIDLDKRSPYKSGGESAGPLDRINIKTVGGMLVDLKQRSNVVAALTTFQLFRAYFDPNDGAAKNQIGTIVNQEVVTCQR